jgi:hypothetical protein
MDNLPTTVEALAAMINTRMASREDIREVKEDIQGINTRLDRIEHLLLEEQ